MNLTNNVFNFDFSGENKSPLRSSPLVTSELQSSAPNGGFDASMKESSSSATSSPTKSGFSPSGRLKE